MLTSVRSLLAATVITGAALAATPAMAQDDLGISVSGNAAIVTDYRFRGVGLSNGNVAVQGGIDLSVEPGIYIGTWGSSLGVGDRSITLDDGTGSLVDYNVGSYGGTEIDIYGGWSGDITEGVGVDIGAIYYLYPDATNVDAAYTAPVLTDYPTFAGYDKYDTDYFEFYGSVSPSIGPASLTFGVAYAPKQDSLGGDDNLYLYSDVSIGVPSTPVTLTGHVGYTDGYITYTTDGNAWDYSVGASITVLEKLSLGVSYVGVEHSGPETDGVTDDTVVGTLSISF